MILSQGGLGPASVILQKDWKAQPEVKSATVSRNRTTAPRHNGTKSINTNE